MAVTTTLFDSFTHDLGNGAIDTDGDTFKVLLTTGTYTPSLTAHTKRSDVTNEVTGAGYTAGGKTLASVTWTLDTTNHRTAFDAADVTWTTSTFTARYAVIYKSRGGAASADELVALIDFGADQTVSGADFTISWAAVGIFTSTRS